MINLHNITLTAADMECVTVFLTSSSHKEWKLVNFHSCYMQDHGLHILHHGLCRCSDVTIDELRFDYNSLTMQSSSLISELTVRYKVKELGISGNHTIGEDQQLYSMLTDHSNILESLYMADAKLSFRAAIALFTAVQNNNKLEVLDIIRNAVTDDACDAIAAALKMNSHLVKLIMYDNPLTDEAIINILDGLKDNNKLAVLWFPSCSEAIKKTIDTVIEDITKKRKSRKCQVKLEIRCPNYSFSSV